MARQGCLPCGCRTGGIWHWCVASVFKWGGFFANAILTNTLFRGGVKPDRQQEAKCVERPVEVQPLEPGWGNIGNQLNGTMHPGGGILGINWMALCTRVGGYRESIEWHYAPGWGDIGNQLNGTMYPGGGILGINWMALWTRVFEDCTISHFLPSSTLPLVTLVYQLKH
jgi:hypothetical protein